jgi:hypothetical protein
MSNLCTSTYDHTLQYVDTDPSCSPFMALLKSLSLVGSSTETFIDFTDIIAQRSLCTGMHHAIIEIFDCILSRPFELKFTQEYIDVWSGFYEIRKHTTSSEHWRALHQCMQSLVQEHSAQIHVSKWCPDTNTIIFPIAGETDHNSSLYMLLPWRMNTLRTFLGSLLHMGLKFKDLQVEIAQAVQIGCRQSVLKLSYDLITHSMIPCEENRQCLIEALPLVTNSMAHAWHSFAQ